MISFKTFPDGFEYIEVVNSIAKAKIALQGAHLFHYERHGETPLLWVSKASNFTLGESIRGGIPLCWPWFGMHKTDADMPQHGFARTFMWKLIDSKDLQNTSKLTLLLVSSEESLTLWPYQFELTYTLTIGRELSLELTTKNLDTEAFSITQALHTYFNISHISNIHVNGLQNKPYFDALTGENIIQKGAVTFNSEIDRVYQNVNKPINLMDKRKKITISTNGSNSAVVWNPWIEKCARMSAMENDSYKTMVCIESANAFDDARTIEPGDTHTLKASIVRT
ncbi:MAG: D-hexose-6-phosphate mutarotase [Campylobacterota bacterium]|nr:D-hexose-6-phosphate mutarotase [Campylobacterota bacterium]